MKPLAMLPCALLLALAAPMAAQPMAAQASDQTDSQAPAQAERCQAEPQARSGAEQKPPLNDNLTAKLDSCDGVLRPPPTGDLGMTTPPPDEGKMPVIKPGEVPAQPPKQ